MHKEPANEEADDPADSARDTSPNKNTNDPEAIISATVLGRLVQPLGESTKSSQEKERSLRSRINDLLNRGPRLSPDRKPGIKQIRFFD